MTIVAGDPRSPRESPRDILPNLPTEDLQVAAATEPPAPLHERPQQESRRKGPSLGRISFYGIHLPVSAIPRPVLSAIGLVTAVTAFISALVPLEQSELGQSFVRRIAPPYVSITVNDENNKPLPSERKNFVVEPGQVLALQLQPGSPPFWLAVLDEHNTHLPLTGPASVVPFHAPPVSSGTNVTRRLVQPCMGDYEKPYWCGEAVYITMSADAR